MSVLAITPGMECAASMLRSLRFRLSLTLATTLVVHFGVGTGLWLILLLRLWNLVGIEAFHEALLCGLFLALAILSSWLIWSKNRSGEAVLTVLVVFSCIVFFST